MISLNDLEGKKFCVVFVKVLDEKTGKMQLQCLRGRASVDRGQVSVITSQGTKFTIPTIAQRNILPSDGTELLQDAEYYCLVKVDPQISLGNDPSFT